MYDGVLTLALPPDVKITGFVDDIAFTVSAVSIEEVEMLATDAAVLTWYK